MLKHYIQKILWKLKYDLSKLNYNNVELSEFFNLLRPIKLKGYELKRFGNQSGDGGYILPNDFQNIECLFSLGVGKQYSFEEDMKSRNIKCFLADYSVENSNFENLGLNFHKKFIKAYNSKNSLRFEDWKDQCLNSDEQGEFIIQVDIEGDEYQVLLSINNDTFDRTKYLIIEYHFLTKIFDLKIGNLIMSTLKRVSEKFYPIHLSINNTSSVLNIQNANIPHTLEVSYINKKYVKDFELLKDSNHHLNRPNISNSDPIEVPRDFFS